MKTTVKEWIKANRDDLVALSDTIWRAAELGLVERESASAQIQYLKDQGFEIRQGIGGMDTAFVASWGQGKPVIAFLGEYDALPAVSNKPVPRPEPLIPGAPGHGCGHNLLGVASIGAAGALKTLVENEGLPGQVRYYGCPAEESSFGKTWMVRDGAFDDVDIALTWHPGAVNSVSNSSSLADLVVKFNFHGRTAHAAGDPWNGRSALDGVELMNAGIERMREHIRPENRIHYIISHGGGAPNVVPDFAQSFFDVRAADIDELKKMYAWVLDIAKGASLMTQTRFEPLVLGYAANLAPNKTIARTFHEIMEDLGAPSWTEEEIAFARQMQSHFDPSQLATTLERLGDAADSLSQTHLCDVIVPYSDKVEPGRGSTDVGDVSWVVPTAQFSAACSVLGIPGHSWAITACSGTSIGHKGMLFAAEILACAGHRLLTDPALRDAARAEWKEHLKGKVYENLIPPSVEKPPLPFGGIT